MLTLFLFLFLIGISVGLALVGSTCKQIRLDISQLGQELICSNTSTKVTSDDAGLTDR